MNIKDIFSLDSLNQKYNEAFERNQRRNRQSYSRRYPGHGDFSEEVPEQEA